MADPATNLADGVPQVYNELRRLAAQYLRRERFGHTLQPTALVHEAYIQMSSLDRMQMQSRTQFFGAAAAIMRRILVTHARRRRALKRQQPLEFQLESNAGKAASGGSVILDTLVIDQLLERLQGVHAQASRILELRFFAGLNDTEIAGYLNLSRATVQRHLTFGRAWMVRELKSPAAPQ